jgi:general secretion pathway protein E
MQTATTGGRAGSLSTTLPFNPIVLIVLVGWVYLSMYFVQRVQFSELVPKSYKGVAKIATVFVGPVLMVVLFIVDTARKSRRHQENPFVVLKRQLSYAIGSVRALKFAKPAEEPVLRLLDASGKSLDEICGHSAGRTEDAKVLSLTEKMIADALEQRASDILIDPKDDSLYTVRLRIDGHLSIVKELDTATCRAVINSIKAVSGLDISERRRPQDGGFTARKGETTASFRVASAGALNGEKLSIRVLNKDAATLTLADIGLMGSQADVIKGALAKPSGMILICGPTGSGKTTTMYAMLNEIDRFTRNVITVEDPIESVLPQASQIEINPKAGITFASTLRSVLRQDPDVICVGEIRDEETAEIALRASQTGHLVLATIHCDSNAAAMVRLIDLGISRLLLSSALSLVVSQRLLRCLCERCKRPAKLSDSQIVEFNKRGIDTSAIFQAGQCRQCQSTGYYGRTAICDVLTIDQQRKAEIADSESLIAKFRNDEGKVGRSSLRKCGMKRVLEGITSLEELKRVIG